MHSQGNFVNIALPTESADSSSSQSAIVIPNKPCQEADTWLVAGHQGLHDLDKPGTQHSLWVRAVRQWLNKVTVGSIRNLKYVPD